MGGIDVALLLLLLLLLLESDCFPYAMIVSSGELLLFTIFMTSCCKSYVFKFLTNALIDDLKFGSCNVLYILPLFVLLLLFILLVVIIFVYESGVSYGAYIVIGVVVLCNASFGMLSSGKFGVFEKIGALGSIENSIFAG